MAHRRMKAHVLEHVWKTHLVQACRVRLRLPLGTIQTSPLAFHVRGTLMPNPENDLASMAALLQQSDDYRVLRRQKPRATFTPDGDLPTKTAVLLDIETTGLNSSQDEVIEFGMVKFTYLADGRIVRARLLQAD
jgi:uncharacterized protein YprB with RNaseH-like and TPR domain